MKTVIAAVVTIFALSACGSDSSKSDSFTVLDEENAQLVWDVAMTDEERALMCDVYYSYEKDFIIKKYLEEDPDMTKEEVEILYAVLNKEC